MAKFIYNHRVQDSISDIESRISDVKESEIVLANVDEKIVFKNKTGNIVTISSDAYNADKIAGFFDGAEYVKDVDNNIYKIVFKHGDVVKAEIDASDFIKDGMIEDVKVEDGYLKIIFNTDSGHREIDIELTDIFNPDNYYTKDEVNTFVSNLEATDNVISGAVDNVSTELENEAQRALSAETELKESIKLKVDKQISGSTGKALIFNESDGGGAKFEHNDGTYSFVGVNDAGNGGIAAQIYAKTNSNNTGSRLDVSTNGMYYTVGNSSASERMIASNEIATKGNIEESISGKANADAVYTKGEIDGKENALQASINANTNAISGEETRATNAEQALQNNIDAEESRAKAEEIKKVDRQINGTNGKALIFNETDGGGAKFENIDGTHSYVGVNDGGANGIAAQIYAKDASTNAGTRLDVSTNAMYYTVGSDSSSDRMVPENEIAVKGDFNGYYTQEEVDALLLAKENEIYNLTKIVGDIGGAVTYNLPNEAGKSFNTLMNNNGTVKLTDDVTTGRFGPGITAKNKVKLNLNNNDLAVTGLTITSAQGAIMARGAQEITIYGKGTIDAGNGICVEGNGADSVINLTGSTTVYQTDRSGAELIYCYAGTINITNGTFKNNGEDKKFLLNCYDANYRAGTAKIIVTGGKFYDFDPGNNEAEGPGTSFLAEGYHTESSTVVEEGVEHTIYTVKKD